MFSRSNSARKSSTTDKTTRLVSSPSLSLPRSRARTRSNSVASSHSQNALQHEKHGDAQQENAPTGASTALNVSPGRSSQTVSTVADALASPHTGPQNSRNSITLASQHDTRMPSTNDVVGGGAGEATLAAPKDEVAGNQDANQEQHATADANAQGSSVLLTEHTMATSQVCLLHNTSVNESAPAASMGLTESEAAARLAANGPNVMSPPKQVSPIIMFLKTLCQIFNVLLIVAGVALIIINATETESKSPVNYYVGALLITITILNTAIEFTQVQSVNKAMLAFANLVPDKCRVIRDGNESEVLAADLVVGDVLHLNMGDKVPADVRLFSCSNFTVDNSALTGESEPQERSPQNPSTNPKQSPLEAPNMAFNGTLAVGGEAYGVVVRTADDTVIGQIATLTQRATKRTSPLVSEIENFVYVIGILATTTALVFALSLIIAKGSAAGETVRFAVAIVVAWVPQGLPFTVSILLKIAATRMRKKNVLVKELAAVETLGALTMLATDKTGTLTRNQMTVSCLWTQKQFYDASGDTRPQAQEQSTDPQPEGFRMGDGQDSIVAVPHASGNSAGSTIPLDTLVPGVEIILHIAALCTRARFDSKGMNRVSTIDSATGARVPSGMMKSSSGNLQRKIIGDATETGLFRFAAQHLDVENLESKYPKVFEIPFNSDNKWHLSVHRMSHDMGGSFTAFIKGAPERVLKLCSSMLVPGDQGSAATETEMTDTLRAEFMESYERLASQGHRVLAFARLQLNPEEYPENYKFSKDEESSSKSSGSSVVGGGFKNPSTGYTFVGLVSLEDPPKHGVREAIGTCRRAGIKVVMVTGDHPLTAEAVSRKINLMTTDTRAMVARRAGVPIESIGEDEADAVVVHGDQIDSLTSAQWDNIFSKEEIIFARTTPKQKLMIVKRAQAVGHIVGVTGDGVNDSPALRKADLGIAMNISGSAVSKEAATMILLDDNFASVVHGIREGRLIFSNLKKSIRYVLSHISPEVFPNIFAAIFLSSKKVLEIIGSFHILLIDLGFEMTAALSYAFEPPESEKFMKLMPRKPVTPESVGILRSRAVFDLQYSQKAQQLIKEKGNEAYDPILFDEDLGIVSGGVVVLTFKERVRRFWSLAYWKFCWSQEKPQGEVLVDKELMSYAYLEAGLVESLGALVLWFVTVLAFKPVELTVWEYISSFLNSTNQSTTDALNEQFIVASYAFFLGVLFAQIGNLFACKFRLKHPFSKHNFKNKYTFVSIAAGLTIALVFFFVPGFNYPNSLAKAGMPLLLVAVPFIGILVGFILFCLSGVRYYIRSRIAPTTLTPEPPGLQMHPTRWSRIEA